MLTAECALSAEPSSADITTPISTALSTSRPSSALRVAGNQERRRPNTFDHDHGKSTRPGVQCVRLPKTGINELSGGQARGRNGSPTKVGNGVSHGVLEPRRRSLMGLVLEQRFPEPCVGGSIPAEGTILVVRRGMPQ